jgi:hypothetical protein
MYIYRNKNGQIVKEGYDGDQSKGDSNMGLFYLLILFIVFGIIISQLYKKKSNKSSTGTVATLEGERTMAFRFY